MLGDLFWLVVGGNGFIFGGLWLVLDGGGMWEIYLGSW